ncbi:MAG: Bax inhibitor-1/YccA family protein [Candidatus Adiutrix sp.]|jgi:FtsH-binding integral membrane protein|nr:Bax inhibitor-1/YccA family protein [Candidatus Adiutrix sp.]
MQDFTNYNPNSSQGALTRAASSEALFFQRVYLWMCGGLALTAVAAYALMRSQIWLNLLQAHVKGAMISAFVVELGLVIYLSARINKLTPGAAKALFLAYAAVNACTFSVIGMMYSSTIMFKAFISTAGVYGAMAVYGLTTRRSLQGLGSFLFMGVVGLFIAIIVNAAFVASSRLDLVICVIGVLIFAGLTAYDHQKLRVIYATGLDGSRDGESRVVVMGALSLYLDFINMFLFLLRLFGASRD